MLPPLASVNLELLQPLLANTLQDILRQPVHSSRDPRPLLLWPPLGAAIGATEKGSVVQNGKVQRAN
jgi:hypothetical protein